MKISFYYFLLFCISIILGFSSCQNQDKKADSQVSALDSLPNIDTTTITIDVEEKEDITNVQLPFIQKTHTNKSVDEVYAAIKKTIEENKDLKIIAELNHAQLAKEIKTEIPYSRLIIFGNPKVGTQLMQKNQKIGMDLPMKMLVYEDQGTTKVIYNNGSILMSRYEIMLPELEEKINSLLDQISHSEIEETKLQHVKLGSSLVDLQTKESSLSVDKASEKLEKLLQKKNFKLFAKVEHDKAAKKENLELRPTRLFIFGKPEMGSQLMKLNSTIGLDLPMKILIWEDENGKTQISYFKGALLVNRHSITNPELTTKIENALEILTNEILK